jgi:hypothetical protein
MPGMLLFLGASRVSFQPGVDPFGLQSDRTSAADANVAQFLALARRVDGVSTQAGVLRSLPNVQPRLHRATLLTRRRVTQPRRTVTSVDAPWRADLWPVRREQWREMRADVAGIEDRDAGRRGRRTTRGHAARSSGAHWPRCSLEWPGDTATPRWCTAAAWP